MRTAIRSLHPREIGVERAMSTGQGSSQRKESVPLWLYVRPGEADELIISFDMPSRARRRPTDIIQNLIRRAVGEVYDKQSNTNALAKPRWEVNPATRSITVNLGAGATNKSGVVAAICTKLDTLLDEAGAGTSTHIAP